MGRNRMLFGVMGGVLAISLCLGVALAQQGGRGGGQGRAGGGFAGARDPGQMRQMMNDRIKEALGATDEEWQVIGPRLEKVSTLQREAAAGGSMRALFGGRGGRGGAGGQQRPDAPERERSAVEQAMGDLQQVVDDESAAADQIKQKLTALREAREKAKQQLVKAQQELREVLTLRQEAQLVLFGMLD